MTHSSHVSKEKSAQSRWRHHVRSYMDVKQSEYLRRYRLSNRFGSLVCLITLVSLTLIPTLTRGQDTLNLVKAFQTFNSSNVSAWSSLPDSARVGGGLAGIGDIDDNGVPDVAVGSGAVNSTKGGVWILYLGVTGGIDSTTYITHNTNGMGALDAGDGFGTRITGMGDFDGNGVEDIAVLASGDDDVATDYGAVYILLLNAAGRVSSVEKITYNQNRFMGTMSGGNDFNGDLKNLGDMNNDGVTDLGVGAYLSNDGGTDRGAFWILYLKNNAGAFTNDSLVKGYDKISKNSTWPGTNPLNTNGANFGFSLAGLGDIDGDGFADLAVTARIQGGKGKIYVIFRNSTGGIKSYQVIAPDGTGGLTTSISNNGGHFAWCLENMGDVNGDGIVDLLASARMQDDGYTRAGMVLMLYLNPNGTVLDEEVISQTQGTDSPLGLATDAWFGFRIANLGDIDGDLVSDIAVSATGLPYGSQPLMGKVFVLRLRYRGIGAALELTEEPSAAFYTLPGRTLQFVHEEDIPPPPTGANLTYEVTDDNGTVKISGTGTPLALLYGTNIYSIALGSAAPFGPAYTLAVTDQRGTTKYVRFK